jgi:hypothetical protein
MFYQNRYKYPIIIRKAYDICSNCGVHSTSAFSMLLEITSFRFRSSDYYAGCLASQQLLTDLLVCCPLFRTPLLLNLHELLYYYHHWNSFHNIVFKVIIIIKKVDFWTLLVLQCKCFFLFVFFFFCNENLRHILTFC